MNKIKEYRPTVRNDEHILNVGVLLRPTNSLAFKKHNFMVVTELVTEGKDNYYMLYSQKEQRYWKMRCWLVNSAYVIESSNTENNFPK